MFKLFLAGPSGVERCRLVGSGGERCGAEQSNTEMSRAVQNGTEPNKSTCLVSFPEHCDHVVVMSDSMLWDVN